MISRICSNPYQNQNLNFKGVKKSILPVDIKDDIEVINAITKQISLGKRSDILASDYYTTEGVEKAWIILKKKVNPEDLPYGDPGQITVYVNCAPPNGHLDIDLFEERPPVINIQDLTSHSEERHCISGIESYDDEVLLIPFKKLLKAIKFEAKR